MAVTAESLAGSSVKSPDAFRTISEVSGDLSLPQHVLRFWETRFAQIKPMKRGGGRRLYRPDHVALLRGIKALLYDDGMTIKGVQKVLREKGTKDRDCPRQRQCGTDAGEPGPGCRGVPAFVGAEGKGRGGTHGQFGGCRRDRRSGENPRQHFTP